MSRQIEDEKHFIYVCQAYRNIREELYNNIRRITNNQIDLSVLSDEDDLWIALMNPHQKKIEIAEALKMYIQKAMKRRSYLI